MLLKSIRDNSLLLAIFALLTTAIIAGSYLSTKDKIQQNIRQAQQKALLDIIPLSRHNNSMLDDFQWTKDQALLGLRENKQVFIARQSGQVVAVIIPATARDGYTGDIDFIIGINIDGSIAGIRVLSHRETPGLGDAIDSKKSDWVLAFDGRSLSNTKANDWAVKKDGGVFDQFTGATITPRAMVNSVKKALDYFQEHSAQLLAPATGNRQVEQ